MHCSGGQTVSVVLFWSLTSNEVFLRVLHEAIFFLGA